MKKLLVLLLIIIFSVGFSFSANEDDNRVLSLENRIKSAFIYNFTKYIQWSDNDTSESFKIGIIGDSDIITPLQVIAKKKLAQNRKIEIEHYRDIKDSDMCHILFISASGKRRLKKILQRIKKKNILTISDIKPAGINCVIHPAYAIFGCLK